LNHTKGNITELASDFVFDLLKTKLPSVHVYHNFTHTAEVVDSIKKIGSKSGLSEDELEPVILAGLFHDTGFTVSADNHEDKELRLPETSLEQINIQTIKLK
jgi:HD-GYP domain-containing protein (c-di-GMP phosphodiesterase class II)